MMEDVLIGLSSPSDPRISPDALRVAYVAVPYSQKFDRPRQSIWVVPIDGSAAPRQFTASDGRDDEPRWSPDGKTLAFLSDREKAGVRRLYCLPSDGGEAYLLLARKTSIGTFRWSPDGDKIAFTAADEPTEEDEQRAKNRDDADAYGERWPFARLCVLDVCRGQTVTLPTGDVHVVDLAWSPSGTSIAYLAAKTPEVEAQIDLFIAPAYGGTPRQICSPVGRAHQLTWTTDGRRLLYVGHHEETPQSALTVFAVDVDGGMPRVIGPRADEDACGIGVQAIPGDSRVLVATARGLSSRLELIDLDNGSSEPIYDPPGANAVSWAATRVPSDGSLVLAVVQSDASSPPELWVGSPGRGLTPVTGHHADLRQFAFGPQEPFSWTSPDDLALDGLLVWPPSAPKTPLPTVVLVHGGPYGRWPNGWSLSPVNWAQLLATHGYLVLLPNCRGGQGHGNRFAIAPRGDVGGADFLDVMAAVDAAIARGIADPERLGIGGWSQGGFMTAWAVTQTDRFRAGVMGAGISDWRMMVMESDMPILEATLGGDRPWDGPGPWLADLHSPVSFAKNVETPLLILHGRNDARVPIGQAVGFERALRQKGIPVQLVVYPREGHVIQEASHLRDLLRRVVGWYDRWLKEESGKQLE